MKEYKPVPGRGLLARTAIELRLQYLKERGFDTEEIEKHLIDPPILQNNIESFIGSVEVPVGLVGPLQFNDEDGEEEVITAVGTLEGALVASMNRGAKAISMSGGFKAKVHHQHMLRSPLFILESDEDAEIFKTWVESNFENIKSKAEGYSNHATLQELTINPIGPEVHILFSYKTGDASGQNMTTTCTWHAVLWIVDAFLKDEGIEITDYVIEANGSSDKKVSQLLLEKGRGVSVEAECFIEEAVLKKVLRTTSDRLHLFYISAVKISKQIGMMTFNVNVANAIAGIFVATGQDLACIHESSLGLLTVEKQEGGLMFNVKLPSLTIGTVGGGTTLPKQNQALDLMKCSGSGKIERFAKLIAGFTLGLEVSTISAISSGEFSKAHEKLGRNKPTDWLLRKELDSTFLMKCFDKQILGKEIISIDLDSESVDNGILTNTTQRVSNKITGFIPINIHVKGDEKIPVLIKSKGLDIEVLKGLHMMAASIDTKLSDLLFRYRHALEYEHCHIKELEVNRLLHERGFNLVPKYYGEYVNVRREIYLLFQENLERKDLSHFDSENSPNLWKDEHIQNCIQAIHRVHIMTFDVNLQSTLSARRFEPWKSLPFYQKMADVVCAEDDNPIYRRLFSYMAELEGNTSYLSLPICMIHNDFNPRNVAIRNNGDPCIYDWELAVLNIPHRDIVEFLCFALPIEFDQERFISLLAYHSQLSRASFRIDDIESWEGGYVTALKEFLVTRGAYYKAADVLFQLKFSERIMLNGFRMIDILESRNRA